jgi:predicted extracellular nuclease
MAIALIHTIQGNATTQLTGGVHNDVSPLNGQTVTIEGIVTADFQLAATSPNNVRQLRGFFIQEETVDQDGNPTTSEGIFISTGDDFITNGLDVQEGQKVRVTGVVSESFGMTQISATSAGSITVVDAGNNLNQITPAIVDLPVVGDINDYYEQFEGMKVTFSDKLVVSEYFELARYGQIVLTANQRPFQYTHIDNTPTAAEYAAFLDNLARTRIILDDDDNTQNSPLTDGDGKVLNPQPGG